MAIRLVLVGKTGAGKSCLGNTLLGNDCFKSQGSFGATTNTCQWGTGSRFGTRLEVTDTPGVSDIQRNEDEILKEITKSIAAVAPGPHVILMLIRFRTFTKEEHDAYQALKKLFGKDFTRFVLVVFTGADDMEGATFETRNQWFKTQLQSAPAQLKSVLEEVGGRYFIISNKDPRPQRDQQAELLIRQVQAFIGSNKNQYFNNELLEQINHHVLSLIRHRMETKPMSYDEAADEIRREIVENKDKSGFYEKYKDIIKGFLGGGVMAAAIYVAPMCSVM